MRETSEKVESVEEPPVIVKSVSPVHGVIIQTPEKNLQIEIPEETLLELPGSPMLRQRGSPNFSVTIISKASDRNLSEESIPVNAIDPIPIVPMFERGKTQKIEKHEFIVLEDPPKVNAVK